MQDSSLGATLALTYFSPAAAIASTLFSIWHNISGSVLSSWWKNHTRKVWRRWSRTTGVWRMRPWSRLMF